MFEFIFLIAGLLGLWLGTELVIKGALNIAEHYKLSHIFIGLTILAIGTDLPEIVIAITGAFERLGGVETSGVIVGDAIGSSFGQIALVLGIAGLLGYLTLTKKEIRRDLGMLMVSVLLVLTLSLDGELNLVDGLILIAAFITYYFILFKQEELHEKVKKRPSMDLFWDVISLIAGLFIVIYAATLVVDNAVLIAEAWGVSQLVIGVLIIGIGTSLPEFAVAIAAAMKGAKGLSIGNLVGSSISDLLIPLGAAAGISGLVIDESLIRFDLPLLLILSLILMVFFTRKKGLQKGEAVLLLLFYAGYAVTKLVV